MPTNDFDGPISFVPDLDLVQSVAGPVIALTDKSRVKIVEGIVVMAEVIGGIDKGSVHRISIYLFQS